MALVGDVLFSTRTKIPDLPPTLPAPTATAVVVTVASTLPAGTYFVEVTQRTPWGETLPSSESAQLTIGAGQAIQITSPLFPGATTIRAYLTLANGVSGSEIQFIESSSSPFTISAPLTSSGTPPTRSTAYLLDSDGPMFGASTVYGWLNSGLNKFARAAGGILDYSGVPTIAGKGMYVVNGEWSEISDLWYGGYWVKGGKRAEYFKRNTVQTSILNAVTVSVFSDKQVIEVDPQPDRNSGVTQTTAAMSQFDMSVPIQNTGAFLLPFGFAIIGSEIVAYYTLNNGQIGSLIRGLGQTVAQAWPVNTTVFELSIFWCGKRLTMNGVQPGSAYQTLYAPQGWAAILPNYLLAQAKKAELDLEGSKALEETFFREIKDWMMANKGVATRVQVGGNTTTLSFNPVLGQGTIVPY